MLQPSDHAHLTDTGELVLFKYADRTPPIDQLCRVEELRFEQSREFGMTIQVELREVDENLDSFHSLLKHP